MSSFHHSRARIFFEVCCAFGVSACSVWAWMQTYATAMLPIAAIAGLYGLVHAFDMVRRKPADDKAMGAVEPAADEAPLDLTEIRPFAPVAEPEPVIRVVPLETLVESTEKRERKAPRKKAGRGKKAVQAVAVAGIETVAEVAEVAAEPVPIPTPRPELQPAVAETEEPEYSPIAPLFEAEPFVRQQRAAFGRKARR